MSCEQKTSRDRFAAVFGSTRGSVPQISPARAATAHIDCYVTTRSLVISAIALYERDLAAERMQEGLQALLAGEDQEAQLLFLIERRDFRGHATSCQESALGVLASMEGREDEAW